MDVEEVSEFNAKYELYDPCTIMFFYKNKVRRPPSGTEWAFEFVRSFR